MPEGLLAGYHRYARALGDGAAERERLACGQSPRTLWIGCSDSRVVPELITDAPPGELFVLRNVANIVPPAGTDDTVGAVVEYAVVHLGVAVAVVCGHTGCGGVAALTGSLDAATEPHLAHWIELARPAMERVRRDADTAALTADALADARVRANVVVQREHLLTYPCVADAVAAGELAVFAAVFDIESGEVEVFGPSTNRWHVLGHAEPDA